MNSEFHDILFKLGDTLSPSETIPCRDVLTPGPGHLRNIRRATICWEHMLCPFNVSPQWLCTKVSYGEDYNIHFILRQLWPKEGRDVLKTTQ